MLAINTFVAGLGDVARRLRELQESCEALPDCQELITQYADQLRINNEFDQVMWLFGLSRFHHNKIEFKKSLNIDI